jgi:ABC-type glycerol-3-phosphate transport system permease component
MKWRTKVTAKRTLRGVVLHAVLVAGSILFSAPFVWLASTSAKSSDELYPPQWMPPSPPEVAQSPYMALRDNERAVRPLKVSEEDWERQGAAVRAGITEGILARQGEFPAFWSPYLDAPDLAEAVFARILKRAPDEVFRRDTAGCVGWFMENATVEVVREAFDLVYRRFALAEVVFVGWDMSSEQPLGAEEIEWEVLDGEAWIVPRLNGLGRAAQEVHYSFAEGGRVVVQTVLPLAMRPENFRKVRVANRGDRSWYPLRVEVEMGGQRYRAAQSAFLRTERWQDSVWQVSSEEDRGVMVKTWLRMKPAEPSEFREPGRVRLTVELRYRSRLGVLAGKYLYNYTEVLRKVPLWQYVRNSVVLVALNIAGQLLGSSLVAYAFARLRWPGREFCFVLLLATLMIPPQVTLIPVFLIWKQLGFYNTLKPLYLPAFFGSAFFIFLLRQFMRTIPGDLEDSAKIDGCGYFGIYARIIMPLVKPALATIAIFTFMNVWNDFMGPLIFVADQELYPLSLGLFALHAMLLLFAQHEVMMAAAVLMTLPVVLLFFLAQRQFIQGITLTGLKG